MTEQYEHRAAADTAVGAGFAGVDETGAARPPYEQMTSAPSDAGTAGGGQDTPDSDSIPFGPSAI